MSKIIPQKAIEKCNEYLAEVERLKKIPVTQGKSQREELDEKIRSLINSVFDDSKDKLDHYKTNPSFALSTGMTDEETNHAIQDYHIQKLENMKKYLIGYREELLLSQDTIKETTKLNELEEKIKEVNLEKDRRQGVAEQKFYGAVIELLDFQRNELKRRNENTQNISELKSKIINLEDKLQNISHSNTSKNLDEEDIWYNELNDATSGSMLTTHANARKTAKMIYSEIKLLKKEIAELSYEMNSTSNYPRLQELGSSIEYDKSKISTLLKQLAELWSEFT